MGRDKNKKFIDRPNLILCEGEDTTLFIIWYLEYLRRKEHRFDDFLAFDFHGNDELPDFLSDIRLRPGYDCVESMIIVRDSETNHNSAAQAVKSALENHGFPVPPKPNTIAKDRGIKVAFSLFPTLSVNSRSGTLEDLYMDNLLEDEVEYLLSDIQLFLDGLKSKGRSFTWFHKSKLHTYFSVTDKFVSKKIGQATEAGAFNFECTEMHSFRELLIDISGYQNGVSSRI